MLAYFCDISKFFMFSNFNKIYISYFENIYESYAHTENHLDLFFSMVNFKKMVTFSDDYEDFCETFAFFNNFGGKQNILGKCQYLKDLKVLMT